MHAVVGMKVLVGVGGVNGCATYLSAPKCAPPLPLAAPAHVNTTRRGVNYPDGATYDGEIKDGKRCGRGGLQ